MLRKVLVAVMVVLLGATGVSHAGLLSKVKNKASSAVSTVANTTPSQAAHAVGTTVSNAAHTAANTTPSQAAHAVGTAASNAAHTVNNA
ncbi:MAG: hypothetical protein PHS37_08610, partial [Candidatus Omnitrophica bacterium]|nr:hypothetical protein [Candidatus Omnitrophota bacterium]